MNIKLNQQSDFIKLELGLDHAYSLIENGESEGLFSLMHYTMGTHSKGPNMHLHESFDQIFIVTKGSPTFIINNIKKQIHFGGIAVAPRGIPHNVVNETDQEVSYLMILKPGGFENFFKDISNQLGILSTENIEELLYKYGETSIK